MHGKTHPAVLHMPQPVKSDPLPSSRCFGPATAPPPIKSQTSTPELYIPCGDHHTTLTRRSPPLAHVDVTQASGQAPRLHAPIMRRGQHVHCAHIRPGVGLDVDPDRVHKHEQGHHTKSDQQLQRQDTWDAHAIRHQGTQTSTQSSWHRRRGSAGKQSQAQTYKTNSGEWP